MAGPRTRIRHALEDLSSEDFSRFTAQMRERREDGLTPESFRTFQVENKTHQQVADLLVDSFSDQAVSVTARLLRAIGNNRVADELGPSTSRRETVFHPIINESNGIKFRFTCPSSGTFRCHSTGVIFEMKMGAELQYKTVQWDVELLQSSGRTPAGPLFDIQSPAGAVCELHLPHCEPESADVSRSQLSVAHISEGKEEHIKPEQITQSHVIIKVSTLSQYGLTAPSVKNRSIKGQVLLFRTPKARHMMLLHVLVLPINVPVDEVMSNYRSTTEYISAPSKCCNDLVIDQFYSVVCPSDVKVQPERARFSIDFDPNYHPLFELLFSQETKNALLKIQKTGDDSEEGELWKYEMDLRDPARRVHPTDSDGSLKKQLESLRPTFVQNVSDSNLNQLLDQLKANKYLNSWEVEAARVKPRADKARDVFDAVKRKGSGAVKFFINTYCEVDKRSDLSDRMREILSETQ